MKVDIGELEPVDEFGGTLFRFKRLRDRKPGQSWVLLVYGPSKTGKTYFAGTAGPRTLFINVGDGIETLLSPAFTSRYPASKDMIVLDVREEPFDSVCRAIDEALASFSDKFDTIVLDEATAFRRGALDRAIQENTAARTKEKRESPLDTFVKADIADYGVEMDMIKWFLARYVPTFKEANKHFIMLAHERQIFGKPPKIGDEAPLQKIVPGFTGKTFPDAVPSYFDDVWHSEVARAGANVIYQLRTIGSGMVVGGARHGGIFKPEERDPNFLEMLGRIRSANANSMR